MVNIRLDVVEPEDRNVGQVSAFPATVGVVFRRGELRADELGSGQLAMFDADGAEVPFHADATAYWDQPRTEVKWLRVRLMASISQPSYELRTGQPSSLTSPQALTSQAADGSIQVSTGAMEVTIDGATGDLLSQVRVSGRRQLRAPIRPVRFTGSVVGRSVWHAPSDPLPPEPVGEYPAVIYDGAARVGEDTGLNASVVGCCCVRDASGVPWCQIDWRAEFFRGEHYVRVYHTLTWLRRAWEYGAADISIQVPVRGPRAKRLVVGADQPISLSYPGRGSHVTQALDDAQSSIDRSGRSRAPGRLSGWARYVGGWPFSIGSDLSVGVCIRSMWQTYPKGFSIVGTGGPFNRALSIDLWPRTQAPMSFRPEDLLPPDYVGQARREEWDPMQFNGAQSNPAFEHSGEGASRTHELVLAFGASTDSIEDLADLVERPIVIRQDPTHAMGVPTLGFDIPARYEGSDADVAMVEERLEDAARQMFIRRHDFVDYGFWRYGFLHWNAPGNLTGAYRTFDGTQYGIQLIPWLLFMRGGHRDFYDEAVTTARYAMDVATNHYTSRKYRLDSNDPPLTDQPIGFAADARLFMFPWQSSRGTMLNKKPKLTYSLTCFHLTGYERARETAELQIRGALVQFKDFSASTLAPDDLHDALVPPDPSDRTGMAGEQRERLNTILFWAEAANEIGDPSIWYDDTDNVLAELRDIARVWWDMILRKPDMYFMKTLGARIHMFDGFGAQRELGHTTLTADPKAVVDAALTETGFDLNEGGIYEPEYTVGAMWAAENGNTSHDPLLWDIAQGTADMIAAYREGALPAGRAQTVRGNQLLRQYVFPMLAGLGAARRIRQTDPTPPVGVRAVLQSDTFVSVGNPRTLGPREAQAYIQCVSAGEIQVAVIIGFVGGGTGGLTNPSITVDRWDGQNWIATNASVAPGQSGTAGSYRALFPHRLHLSVPAVNTDEVIRLTLSIPALNGRERLARWHVNPGDHRIVHPIRERYSAFGCLALDKHRCARFYLTPLGNNQPVRFNTRLAAPFTVRDATSWQTVGHSVLGENTVDISAAAAAAPQLAVITSGRNTIFDWDPAGSGQPATAAGIHPYLASNQSRWFLPPN